MPFILLPSFRVQSQYNMLALGTKVAKIWSHYLGFSSTEAKDRISWLTLVEKLPKLSKLGRKGNFWKCKFVLSFFQILVKMPLLLYFPSSSDLHALTIISFILFVGFTWDHYVCGICLRPKRALKDYLILGIPYGLNYFFSSSVSQILETKRNPKRLSCS